MTSLPPQHRTTPWTQTQPTTTPAAAQEIVSITRVPSQPSNRQPPNPQDAPGPARAPTKRTRLRGPVLGTLGALYPQAELHGRGALGDARGRRRLRLLRRGARARGPRGLGQCAAARAAAAAAAAADRGRDRRRAGARRGGAGRADDVHRADGGRIGIGTYGEWGWGQVGGGVVRPPARLSEVQTVLTVSLF